MDSDIIILILLVGSSLLALGLGLYMLYAKEEHLVKNMEKKPNPEADAYCEKHGITRIQYTRALGRLFLAWSPVYIALYFLVIQPVMENSSKDEIPTDMIIGGVALLAYMAAAYYYCIILGTRKKDY